MIVIDQLEKVIGEIVQIVIRDFTLNRVVLLCKIICVNKKDAKIKV